MNKKNISEATLDDIKRISLSILIDVTNFCDKNNISYYLSCGTLLGAIKYGGFIPWDDDVDIMMPRPSYIKFINNYKNQKYELLNPNIGMYFFAKVFDPNTIVYEQGIDYKKYNPIGIGIDIFPLDGIINDDKIISKITKRSEYLETLLRLSNQPIFYRKNKLKSINRIIPRIIGSKKLVKLIEKNAQKYDYNLCDYVIRYKHTSNGKNTALPKIIYDKANAKFEGNVFCVPKGYDDWLKSFYGQDYLEYTPPLDKRVTHNTKCYLINY